MNTRINPAIAPLIVSTKSKTHSTSAADVNRQPIARQQHERQRVHGEGDQLERQ